MFRKLRQWIRDFRLTLRMKITLSLSAIAVILLVSSIISILEYRSMSNYVSALIADNIEDLPDFNREAFLAHCDSLHTSLSSINLQHLADSVVYSWSAYMLTSLELPNVIVSDFIDTRSWYFERLQPVYGRLHEDIDDLNTAIYNELQKNSATFERGFYRSVIPSAVTVAVGLTLVLLLLFFILTYYVNPIYKMLKGLDSYRAFNTKYNYTFEGDDQLRELNDGISEIAEENWQFRRRIKDLRETVTQRQESSKS